MDAGIISETLYAIAKELAKQAIDSLPELRDGERVQREWFTDGVYYRETVFDGNTFTSQYDFRTRESTSQEEKATPPKDIPARKRKGSKKVFPAGKEKRRCG